MLGSHRVSAGGGEAGHCHAPASDSSGSQPSGQSSSAPGLSPAEGPSLGASPSVGSSPTGGPSPSSSAGCGPEPTPSGAPGSPPGSPSPLSGVSGSAPSPSARVGVSTALPASASGASSVPPSFIGNPKPAPLTGPSSASVVPASNAGGDTTGAMDAMGATGSTLVVDSAAASFASGSVVEGGLAAPRLMASRLVFAMVGSVLISQPTTPPNPASATAMHADRLRYSSFMAGPEIHERQLAFGSKGQMVECASAWSARAAIHPPAICRQSAISRDARPRDAPAWLPPLVNSGAC